MKPSVFGWQKLIWTLIMSAAAITLFLTGNNGPGWAFVGAASASNGFGAVERIATRKERKE